MTPSGKHQSLLRHERDCRLCRHPKREEIEEDFVSWQPPAQLARRHKIPLRAVYRHAHALGLLSRRNRNIRAALAQIIEKVGRIRVTGPTVVAAAMALSKINSNGQWIDRRETVSLNSLFDRMSQAELERYARDGSLPQWFEHTVSGTRVQSAEDSED